MNNLPAWLVKVQSAWVAIGTLLIVLATSSGVPVPQFLLDVFKQEFFDLFAAALGGVITFVQFVRAIFAAKAQAGVQILSAGAKRRYILNPFKLNAA